MTAGSEGSQRRVPVREGAERYLRPPQPTAYPGAAGLDYALAGRRCEKTSPKRVAPAPSKISTTTVK